MRARKLTVVAVVLLCVAQAAGFAAAKKDAVLTQGPERMFWRIQGTDKKGNPSIVYVQGTIHIGDERLYPLEDAVLEAFDTADRVVGELSSHDMESLPAAVQREMMASYRKAGGRNLLSYLTEEEAQFLADVLGGRDQLAVYTVFEPWVLNSVVSTLPYVQAGYDSDLGIDETLLARATGQGRNVTGLDSLRTQLDVLEFGTYDEQLYILRQSLGQLLDDTALDETDQLFEAYLAGDVAAVERIMQSEFSFEDEEADLGQAYVTLIYTDRNRAWATKIEEWLSQGGTTFIFAGCAHFVGPDSVFDFLRADGVIH